MTGLLVSHQFNARYGNEIAAAAARDSIALELLVLPADPEARLADSQAARVEIAYFSSDVHPQFGKPFFSATRKAPGLKWLQVFNAGVDHPVFASLLERGVRLTTSSGAAAEPIADSVMGAVLQFNRCFPRWAAAQRSKSWRPYAAGEHPPDLRGQTMMIFGLGKIGTEIARRSRAFGLHVIGIRRNPVEAEHVDEVHTPDALADLLPRCQWLALACPLTSETRGIINAARLAQLPRGAYVVNISRGEVMDESALVTALSSGHLGGAYLDVFAQEPLPVDSPLWDMPNVVITPHSASASAGTDERINAIFLDNLKRWKRNAPLVNEVTGL